MLNSCNVSILNFQIQFFRKQDLKRKNIIPFKQIINTLFFLLSFYLSFHLLDFEISFDITFIIKIVI